MPSPQLKIKLLGPVEITYENQPFKIGRRMERAILYYLAAENQPVSRTTLIDLLWAEKDDMDHRGALRTALSRLSSAMPDGEMIDTELDQVWLDLSCCWVDLVNFTSSYDSLKNVLRTYHKNRPLPAQIVKQIEEALALWRGEEILQGDNLTAYPEIESWRRSMNRKLSHQRHTLMEHLADHYYASGSLEQALDLFLQLGEMDLLDVNCHLSVLDILTQLRRFQEAVDYCDVLEIAYEEEYNAPLPDAILEKYQYSQIRLTANERKESSEWPISPTMQLPLVGREEELGQLQKAFYRGGIVVVEGELGSGKTRLIQELFQTSHPTPKLFLAPSQEMEISLPLSPLIYALRHFISKDVWEEIDCVWANKLIPLLPELAELREECSTGEYSGTPMAKQQLFDAILHVLITSTQIRNKILFFLDDAQWADKQTLEAIAYLVVQGFFDENGLLVIASRSEEPNRDLTGMIDRFHRSRDIQTIQLNGLSPSELGTLVNQALDDVPSSMFLDRLYRETDGNPFLALEIIRNLLEIPGEVEKFSSAADLPLPENVHAVIRKRLNRLHAHARQILLNAAVIGNEFSLELLSAVTGLGQQMDMHVFDPLIRFGFVYQTGQESAQKARLKFAHEIMREVVLKEATPLRLQAIHRRVAEQLAKSPQADSQAAVIANHYLACGEMVSAFEWFLKAAAYAWTLGAKHDANQIYQQAESLYRNAPTDFFTTSNILEFYRQWGQFAYEADKIDLLEEIGFKLQYLGEQEHDPLLLGVSQMTLANACFLRLKMDTGLDLINKALEYLKHTEHKRIMLEAKLRQATIYWWAMDYDSAIQVCQEGLKIGESIESSDYNLNEFRFYATHGMSYSYIAKGNAKRALSKATEAYDHYFHKINTFNRMRSFNMLANAHLLAANFKTCEKFSDQGLEIARNLKNSFVTQILLVTRSKAEAIQGHLDEALVHAGQAIKLGEEENYTHSIVSANRVVGEIYSYLQNYNLALQHYRVAQLRGGYDKETLYSLENDLSLARALAWMGQLAEARTLATHAFEVSQQRGMTQIYVSALLKFGLCDLLERNLSSAEAHIQQAERQAMDKGLIYEQVLCKVGRARIALSRHQFDFTQKTIAEILAISDQHHMAWMKLRGLQFCSQLHKATQNSSLLRYRLDYQSLIKMFSEHTQSDDLRIDFESAKKRWEEGHAYP